MEIIGLTGFKGSGKDTFARLLTTYGYVKDSFASSLKDVLSIIFSWDRDMLEGISEEDRIWRETPDVWWENKLSWQTSMWKDKYPRFTPRVAMTLIATDMFRDKFNINIWKLSLERRITKHKKVVITDVRFPNEIDLIKENNGKIIRIKRGPEPEWFEEAYQASLGVPYYKDMMFKKGIHESEWKWLSTDFDLVVENNDSPQEMIKYINEII